MLGLCLGRQHEFKDIVFMKISLSPYLFLIIPYMCLIIPDADTLYRSRASTESCMMQHHIKLTISRSKLRL
jgi:hypothetical protein